MTPERMKELLIYIFQNGMDEGAFYRWNYDNPCYLEDLVDYMPCNDLEKELIDLLIEDVMLKGDR